MIWKKLNLKDVKDVTYLRTGKYLENSSIVYDVQGGCCNFHNVTPRSLYSCDKIAQFLHGGCVLIVM